MRIANPRTVLARAALGFLLAFAGPSVGAQQFAPASTVTAGLVPLGPDVHVARLDAPVSLALRAPLREVIARIAAQADLSVAFDDSLPGLGTSVSLAVTSVPARTALTKALAGTLLRALVSPSGMIVLARRGARPARSAALSGAVRDSVTGSPVDGARIELVGTRYATHSRPNGTFTLGDVSQGVYTLRVLRLGYEPLSMPQLRIPEDVASGKLDLVMHRATLALSEIVVTPGYFGLLKPSLATPQALSREQLQTIPQIGEDIYRAVSRLPGVSADDFSAKFNVRGGSGDELYVSLDGLELVEPFHLRDVGGAFSIVDIQSLGTASLTTGGFSAEYGDRLTGVFSLSTSDPQTDRVRTSLGLSVMNARLTSQGGFAGGRGGWLVSARPGYLDVALKLTSVRDSIRPRYYDLFAKAQYDLGRGGRVAMHVLRASDTFRYLQDEDPNIASDYASNYAWLTWDDRFGSRLRQSTVLSGGILDWRRDGDETRNGVSAALIDDHRSLDRIGLRQDWTFDASPSVMVKWGLDAKHEAAAYDYFSTVRDTRCDGIPFMDTTAVVTSPATNKLALYVAPRVRILPTLTVEVGARLDRNSMLGESIVSPRFNLSWEPRSGTTVRGAWGRYSQSQQLFSLQVQDGASEFARSENAEQRILGVEQLLPYGVTARVEAYDRHTTDARPLYTNASAELSTFPEISWDRMRVDRTESRDRGVEFQAARSGAGRMDWSLSYALASSNDIVEGRVVPRALDQRHAVHGDWSFKPASNAWRLSVGGVWHSGWPYTPTSLTLQTLVNSSNQLVLHPERSIGELNSRRLPSYRRVDARFTRYFDTRRGRLSVFGEVYNLFGTQNVRGVWKHINERGRGATVVDDEFYQWPRLPLAGLTWEF
jgi:hypothetical protein